VTSSCHFLHVLQAGFVISVSGTSLSSESKSQTEKRILSVWCVGLHHSRINHQLINHPTKALATTATAGALTMVIRRRNSPDIPPRDDPHAALDEEAPDVVGQAAWADGDEVAVGGDEAREGGEDVQCRGEGEAE
jgi:hypothetical protein